MHALQPAGSHPQMKSRDELIDYLREKGFRLTPQREKIIDIFYTLPDGEHLSAEDLLAILKKEDADISLATSYRTLKLLASLGVLRELDFAEDHKHYELIKDPHAPHQHIICVECGATEEFDSPEAFQSALTLAHQKQFELLDVQLKVFGVCLNCQPLRQSRIKIEGRMEGKPIHSPTAAAIRRQLPES
jgi:Fur family ferric uptake transcriptional regulator